MKFKVIDIKFSDWFGWFITIVIAAALVIIIIAIFSILFPQECVSSCSGCYGVVR